MAVSISGSVTAQTTTDTSGNYSFANLVSGGSYTITPALNGYTFVQPSITMTNLTADQTNQNFATSIVTFEGDVASRPTGDGAVDVLDIIAVGNIIANLPNVTPLAVGGEFQRADSAPRATKGDGSVNVQDLIQIGLYAAARDTLTPASGATAPLPPTANAFEDIAPVNGSNVSDELSAPAAGSATVSAGNATASMGTAVVPIQLNSSNVGGVQFTITYDPAKLSIPSNASITNRAANTSFTFNNSTPGQLGVVAVQSTAGDAFPASTQLFNINFTVAAGAGGGTIAVGFGSTPVPVRASDPAANAATITTTSGSVTVLGPTAAEVTISGRVLTATGRGISNVTVTLTDSAGNSRTAKTTAFGRYRFGAVNAGETYIISAASKRFIFGQPVQILNIREDAINVDFIANP